MPFGRFAFGSFVGALLFLAACETKKPKDGDACKIEDEGTYICADQGTALLCHASRRTALPCRGAHGCTSPAPPSKAPVTCDTSVGRQGDACAPADGDAVTCAEDKKSRLACVDGRRALDVVCRGPKGCNADFPRRGLDESCDRTIATAGDPCNVHKKREVNLASCSADGKTRLNCSQDYDEGTFVVTSICTGPKACTVGTLSSTSTLTALCDRTVATLGADCGTADSNLLTCAADGMAILRCGHATKKYGLEKTCAAKTSCKIVMHGILEDPECLPPS